MVLEPLSSHPTSSNKQTALITDHVKATVTGHGGGPVTLTTTKLVTVNSIGTTANNTN